VTGRAVFGALLLLAASQAAATIEYGPDRPDALAACDQLQYRGERAQSERCYRALLDRDEDVRIRAEAARALDDPRLANSHFQAAARQYPDDPYLLTRWGELYVATHQNNEAIRLFQESLELDPGYWPATLGLAKVATGRFEDRARQWTAEVLEREPDAIGAHILIAQMDLEEGAYDRAAVRLDQALEIVERRSHPPLEVYALKASLDLLTGEYESVWTERALSYNPRYGEVYETLAYFYVITRRYREAIALLRRAIELKPDLYSAHAELGVNLLRHNEVDEAQRHLAIAYRGDPYSAKIVNTLRLIDSFDNFVVTQHDVEIETRQDGSGPEPRPAGAAVILRLHRDEVPILERYVMDLTRRSIETFTERYEFELAEPVIVELYPQQDDFAVRTAGLPGIGLLGVAFGYLVAMNSPSARPEGDFHWGTTLWHEIAHIFTLGATHHLVPRWFSEGVSVFEEWRTGPLPGRHIPPPVFEAMKEGQLLPVADLDQGFVRPTYRNQVIVSYMQAGLICEYIADRWGQPGLAAMLRHYRDGLDTSEAIETALGITPEQFDRDFKAHLDAEFGELLSGFEAWQRALQRAMEAAQNSEWTAAREVAESAIAQFPAYVGSGSAYLVEARASDELGERAAAIETLAEYHRRGGHDPAALMRLSRWLDEDGRRDEAMAVLGDVIWVAPMQEGLHTQLGDWLLDAGHAEEALAEYQIMMAMRPQDQAAAHLRLARAHIALEDRASGREHLLYALDIAPHYREAQQLLMEIVR
jgi:cellulose synthase operon protein C